MRLVDEGADGAGRAEHDRQPTWISNGRSRTLGERQQLAVHLHYFLGLTVDEAAAVMDCTPGTVKSTLFDARSRLRAVLGDDDD